MKLSKKVDPYTSRNFAAVVVEKHRTCNDVYYLQKGRGYVDFMRVVYFNDAEYISGRLLERLEYVRRDYPVNHKATYMRWSDYRKRKRGKHEVQSAIQS